MLFGERLPGVLPYALSFAAGNFLYVAMADLIPHLHRGGHAGHGHAAIGVDRSAWRQVVLIGLGIAIVIGALFNALRDGWMDPYTWDAFTRGVERIATTDPSKLSTVAFTALRT